MTEPVDKVSRTREVNRQKGREQLLKRDKSEQHHAEDIEDDSVEISREARDRASGKKRRNILDYLRGNSG